MSCAIGIDIGTTNSKVALVRLPGFEMSHLETFVTPKIVDGQNVDFDVRMLASKIKIAIRSCVEAARGDDVLFVSSASIGESGVLVYDDGSFSERSLAWFDRRGSERADVLYESEDALRLYGTTGIPAHGNYSLFKLLWMHEQGVSLDGAHWLSMADFAAWLLCGKVALDASLASRTFALDMRTGEISGEILVDFGLPAGIFPSVVPCGSSRGRVSASAAIETGLPLTCFVCVSGHDHMVGSVAVGLRSQGEVLNSTGTSEGILALSKAPLLDEDAFDKRLSNGIYVTPGLYSLYASLSTAGYVFEWACKLIGRNPKELFGAGQEHLMERYLAGDLAYSGVLFLPHLRGSGPPLRTPDARGCFYGLTDATSLEDLAFACYLGVCMELRHLSESMICGMDVTSSKVIGPATKSPLWMQLKADILGYGVRACCVSEPVARGAAMVAAMMSGMDVSPLFEEVPYEVDPERCSALDTVYRNHYLPFYNAIMTMEGGR